MTCRPASAAGSAKPKSPLPKVQLNGGGAASLANWGLKIPAGAVRSPLMRSHKRVRARELAALDQASAAIAPATPGPRPRSPLPISSPASATIRPIIAGVARQFGQNGVAQLAIASEHFAQRRHRPGDLAYCAIAGTSAAGSP